MPMAQTSSALRQQQLTHTPRDLAHSASFASGLPAARLGAIVGSTTTGRRSNYDGNTLDPSLRGGGGGGGGASGTPSLSALPLGVGHKQQRGQGSPKKDKKKIKKKTKKVDKKKKKAKKKEGQ